MTGTRTPAVSADRQLDDARAVLADARDRRHQASTALSAAAAAYETARRHNPAAPTTDRARNAWAEAEHDLVDARAAMEEARDHLTATHRQATTETPDVR